MTGRFVREDVAVVCGIAQQLCTDIGVLDDVIKAIDLAGVADSGRPHASHANNHGT